MPKEVYDFSDLQHWREASADVEPPLRLAVFGDPVAHSASPPMHNAALEQCGIPARYARLHIRPADLAGAFRALPRSGFIGVNLTIPHKANALPLVDHVDEHARRIGVVNTVVVEGSRLAGFNTDGPGLVRAVKAEFGADLRDLRVMVLGAGGGAGRAIAMQCGIETCQRLVLVNRTRGKAQDLAAELEPYFQAVGGANPSGRVSIAPWDDANLRSALRDIDLVINCTSVGMKAEDASPLPADILHSSLLIYDTVYTANRTKLMLAADKAGARSANGLSMLLYQGAISFEIWFKREAPVEVMREALVAFARNRR